MLNLELSRLALDFKLSWRYAAAVSACDKRERSNYFNGSINLPNVSRRDSSVWLTCECSRLLLCPDKSNARINPAKEDTTTKTATTTMAPLKCRRDQLAKSGASRRNNPLLGARIGKRFCVASQSQTSSKAIRIGCLLNQSNRIYPPILPASQLCLRCAPNIKPLSDKANGDATAARWI